MDRKVRRLLIALCMAAAMAIPAAASAQPSQELIVQYKSSVDRTERASARDQADVELERKMLLPRTELVRVPSGSVEDALISLEASDEVASVERNYRVTKAALSDPLFSEQWSILDYRAPIGPGYWGGDPINVEYGWANGGMGEGKLIAIVDTGVDFSHEDLIDRQYTNPGETGADGLGRDKRTNAIDDDGNGFVDDWRGWDFVDNDNNPDDQEGHGTHVAGTAGATADNGKGVVGVAPAAELIALRVLDSGGSGSFADVADAFVYAGLVEADVANASLGATYSIRTSSEREWEGLSFLVDAVETAPETTFVVAAGNDNVYLDHIAGTIDSYTSLPCEMTRNNIRPDNVICVGTVDFSWYSNWGSKVDITAPGTNILSTRMGGGYEKLTGTSMATPHVAGAVAIAGEFFEEGPAQQRSRLYTLGRGSFCGDVDPTSQWWLNQPKNCVGLYGPVREVCPARDGRTCLARPLNLGGMLDRDVDGDRVSALWDNCPAVPNGVHIPGTSLNAVTQYDDDRDGVGNECDPDYEPPSEPPPGPSDPPSTPPTAPPNSSNPTPAPANPSTPQPPPTADPLPIDTRLSTTITLRGVPKARSSSAASRRAAARVAARRVLEGRITPMTKRSRSAARVRASITLVKAGKRWTIRASDQASASGRFDLRIKASALRGAKIAKVVISARADERYQAGRLSMEWSKPW